MVTEGASGARRPIDPTLGLAVSIQAAPGAFALLIGSGVSRAAGIPTGWEITLDLARKVASAEGADPGPDPDVWFANRFGREPSYSELLRELSKAPAIRSRILQSYFEPTDAEREQGLKTPTAAHRSIAALAAAGSVRLIVTTNFDRLIETALEERGLHPTVVSSADSIAGAPPLSQPGCVVVKLHGDYRDSRILNTEAELAKYDRRVSVYLDRLIEDFGWLIIGWSAEWDIALRAAFERGRSRRYPTFWAAHGGLSDQAARLVQLRQAEVLQVADADTFLPRLAEQVAAVAEIGRRAPVGTAAAIASVKRHVLDPGHRILLADLVNDEVDQVWNTMGGSNLVVSGSSYTIDDQLVGTIVAKAKAGTETLAAMMGAGAYWDSSGDRLWSAAVERLSNPDPGKVTVVNPGWDPRLLPALLALYAAGVSACAAGRYSTVAELLLSAKFRTYDGYAPVATFLWPAVVVDKHLAQKLPGRSEAIAPLSDEIEAWLGPLLNDIRGVDALTQAFDTFELLLAYTVADLVNQSEVDPGAFTCPPALMIGCFKWRTRTRTAFERDRISAGMSWRPLLDGMFGQSPERAKLAAERVAKSVGQFYWTS